MLLASMGRLVFTALAVLCVFAASRIEMTELPRTFPMEELIGRPSPLRFSVVALGLAPLRTASRSATSDRAPPAPRHWRISPCWSCPVTAALATRTDDEFGGAQVAISLTPDAGERFAQATRRWAQRRIAIVVDGLVKSTPVVQSEITGGEVRITMGAGPREQQLREAKELARSLQPR